MLRRHFPARLHMARDLLLGAAGGPMFAQLALLGLAVTGSVDRPKVEVWTNRRDDPYSSGQAVRVYFQTDQNAYVTLLRVDTDGRVRVLFPRQPWEDNFAHGGRVYEVAGLTSREAFDVDDYPGVGYLFAVAAADPFSYDPIESAEHWDYRSIANDGRIRGDPYVALTDLAQRIVPPDYSDWDYDIAPYYVQQHYQYPRFLCYDCHSYVSYRNWDPYAYSCVRFRIVVYDDPYYYPYRYYGGTRVVFARPYRPEPRFIFRDRQASDAFITRVRERPVSDDRRRDVGVRGRDLGGTGVIPPPNIQPPRRRPGSEDQGDDRGRGRRPDQPDQRDRPGQRDHRDRPDQPERRDRPDQPEHRDRPDQPDHRDEPGRLDRPARPPAQPERRAAPEERRRADPPPPRAEPRREAPPPRGEPRREAPPPRSEPRAEPKRDPPKDKPRAEPELKRRKP